MSRIVYLPYRPLRDKAWKLILRQVPKKQRKKHRDEAVSHAMKTAMSLPNHERTIESNVLIDEEVYCNNGRRMYFPESPALLEMLWKAKMNLDLDDLDMDLIQPGFTVSWPRCEIDGAKLRGCLVTVLTGNQYQKIFNGFGLKYLNGPLGRVEPTGKIPKDVRTLHVSYWGEEPEVTGEPALYRCGVPNMFVANCLKSEGNFNKFMEMFPLKGAMHRVEDLDEKEVHQQFVITRLLIHLMVYMQACPEHVHDGLPEGRKEREFKSPHATLKGTVIGAPEGLKGTHASPEAHWRNWHFRSYPRRRDGTKRKGAIKIDGTMVNAGIPIDPKTVDDEAARKRTPTHSQSVVIRHS